MANLWYFIKAVVWQWVTAVGIVLTLIEVYEARLHRHRKVPQSVLRIAILLCIVVAVFTAFQDEHEKVAFEQDKVAKLEKQLAEKNPELLGDMNYIDIPQGDNYQNVWIMATIRNLGTPSIVEFMSLVVTLNDGRVVECAAMEIADRDVLHFQGGKTITFTRATDSLSEKGTTPIPTGGQIRGWLKFYAKQLPIDPQEPWAKISKFEVQFRDVRDKYSTMFQTMADLLRNAQPTMDLWDGAVPVFPGANQPFRNVLTPEVSP